MRGKACTHPSDELVTNAEGIQELRCTVCDERLAWESFCEKSEYHGVFGLNDHFEQKLHDIVFPKEKSA